MIVRKLSLAALCLALVLPAAVQARGKSEDIYNATVELATKASAAQVKKGVKMAVLSRKWTISNEKGSEFDASYTKPGRGGDLTAKIHVAYSTKQVKITYAGSEGMDADGTTINRTYNAWVKNLEKDIPIFVEREVVSSE
ncbi:MAG TPA: hypothetical protein VM240_01855 [Verrucomicrobiae bacterium]|nr:hypothetical protein [Verrucomicrobiae bacterium]